VCPSGWTGDHCELSNNSDEGLFYANTIDDTNDNNDHLGIGMAIVAVIVVLAIGLVYYRQARRASAERERTITNSIKWGSDYKDNDLTHRSQTTQINLAPRSMIAKSRFGRQNSTRSDRDEDAYMDAILKTPMKTGTSIDKPEIFIGPPRDEDGHELHNVNII
jgi:hypothetical protein